MPMTSIHLPPYVLTVLETLEDHGHEAWVVGGALRDTLLGKEPSDWDVATSAHPGEVKALFPHHLSFGEKFGTITVVMEGHQVEVTTFRGEGGYRDRRHPEQLIFGVDLATDLQRRDFTINAMAWHPERGLYDPFGGWEDLQRRRIRAVGEAGERFQEDALRLLRAVRFAAQLGFRLEKETGRAIRRHCTLIRSISPERVREELTLLLLSPRPKRGVRLLWATGLLAELLPELLEGYGLVQNPFHAYSVYTHCLLTMAHTPADLPLRWAGLLHDIGKARTRTIDERGYVHFYGHDQVSAQLAEQILLRLRYPRRLVEQVALLIRNHMFRYTVETTDASLRRLILRVGKENIMDLVTLRRADAAAVGVPATRHHRQGEIAELEARLKALLAREELPSRHTLQVKGEDLMAAFGLSPGPLLGRLLDYLFEEVLSDPRLNQRETLLALAEEWLRKSGG